ncbi:MAG: GtrA family protein [Nocardioides sp.]
MSNRWRPLAGEFSRSATIGTIASIAAFVLFNWLVHWSPGYVAPLHDHAITGFVIANTLSILLTYQLSRWWAFRHREPVGFAGGVLTFYAISVISLVIPVACLWVSRNLLDYETALADNISANVVGLFLGFVARFFAFRTFVFQRRTEASEPEPARVSARSAMPRTPAPGSPGTAGTDPRGR